MAVLDFNRYMHVGVIVNSVEETLKKMGKVYTLSDVRISPFPPEGTPKSEVQLMYKGQKTDFSAIFCFLKMGNSELELIEPVSGDSIWFDFLKEKGEGIHHLKFEVDSFNDTIKAFKEIGVECMQYGSAVGPNKGKTWGYFDTTEELGYVCEVLNTQIGEIIE